MFSLIILVGVSGLSFDERIHNALTLDLHAIKSMGGWNDDEFSAQEICETASATGGSADTIKFKWDSDPCQGESVTKCRSIYFRYNNLDSQILVLFKLHSL